MAESDVLVVGLVRNCEGSIGRDLALIGEALSDFRSTRFLLVESDSSDGTVAGLERLASDRPDFSFITLGSLAGTVPERTERLALCRNAYLKAIREEPRYRSIDYVAVADLDGVNTRLTRAGVASCFGRDDWSVCAANQDGPYYDIFALRHDQWCPDNWWKKARFLESIGVDAETALRVACHSLMVTVDPSSPWIEVDSAFGGFAIYKAECLTRAGCEYVGLDRGGDSVCEHVALHEGLRRSGHRIFINPRLINARYTEHTRHLVGRDEIRHNLTSLAKLIKVRLASSVT